MMAKVDPGVIAGFDPGVTTEAENAIEDVVTLSVLELAIVECAGERDPTGAVERYGVTGRKVLRL